MAKLESFSLSGYANRVNTVMLSYLSGAKKNVFYFPGDTQVSYVDWFYYSILLNCSILASYTSMTLKVYKQANSKLSSEADPDFYKRGEGQIQLSPTNTR